MANNKPVPGGLGFSSLHQREVSIEPQADVDEGFRKVDDAFVAALWAAHPEKYGLRATIDSQLPRMMQAPVLIRSKGIV